MTWWECGRRLLGHPVLVTITRLFVPLDSRGHQLHRSPTVEVSLWDDEFASLFTSLGECSYCGVYPLLDVTVERVRSLTECQRPDGLTTITELRVPSGRLVVADDLREQFPIDEEGLASYNSAMGQAQVTELYAEVGLAYGAVSNTSPTLYQTGDDTFVVARAPYDDTDEPSEAYPWNRPLADVCTDLWAYSMADLDHWVSLGGDPTSGRVEVVDVVPGVYEFTLHTGERAFEYYPSEGGTIYASVRRTVTFDAPAAPVVSGGDLS